MAMRSASLLPRPLLLASLLLVGTCGAAVSQVPADSSTGAAIADSTATTLADSTGTTLADNTGATLADSTGTALQDFISTAIEYSPRLGIARENLNIRAARNDAALGQLLPQLSASASVTANRREAQNRSRDFKGERYSLQLNQVLFNWEAFAAKRQALRFEEQHQAIYRYELSLLFAQVADLYLQVLQAQDALESVQAELDAVRSQAEQIQSLYDRQLARITDLRQAQASRSSVWAEQIRLQSELELAREALRAASGLAAGELFTLGAAAAAPQLEGGIQDWVQLALKNNFQIEAGRRALEAAAEGISQGKGVYMPNLALVAQLQDSNVDSDNAPVERADITSIGIRASMPLYSGGSNWAGIREARSNHALAERQLRQVELDTSERVRGAFLQFQASTSLIEAALALVESATLAAEAMQQGFALGTVTSVDVLKAIRDRFRAERDLQQARYDQLRYFLLLKHEAGTLTMDDMSSVSSWFTKSEP